MEPERLKAETGKSFFVTIIFLSPAYKYPQREKQPQHFIAELYECNVGKNMLAPPEVRLQLAAITLAEELNFTRAAID